MIVNKSISGDVVQTVPILQSTQCHLCTHFQLCNLYNANYAHNAICAIHTMPIVHTMPIMRHTQCQLCTQCHFCTQCQFCNPHNANCAHNANFAAQLALDGCIIGIVWVQNWHYLALNYYGIFSSFFFWVITEKFSNGSMYMSRVTVY